MRLSLVAIVLFVCGGLAELPASAAEPQPVPLSPAEQARFRAALDALGSGDWAPALDGFRHMAARPSVVSDYARFYLAESLVRAGELARAREVAEALARDEPESRLALQALLLAAYLAARQGDEAVAERLLSDIIFRFPGDPVAPQARYLLGLTLEAQGRHAEAAATFRDLWLIDPASAYAEAAADQIALLAQGGVILPAPTPEERLGRAERLLAESSLAAAKEEARALLAENLGPALALRAWSVVAQSAQRGGRYGEAAEAVTNSLALAPARRRPGLLLALGRLYHQAGSPQLALGTADRLIREFPQAREVARAQILRGRLFEETGRTQEAVGAYQQVTTEFPEAGAAAEALWRLGWLAYLGGDFPGAAQEFARLAALPAGRAYRLAAAYWAGRARERLGDPETAQELFRRVLADAPRSYYGLLAARRVSGAETAPEAPLPIALPDDPLAPLAAEPRVVKVETLQALGLLHDARAELEEFALGAWSSLSRLYGLSALWERAQEYHRALRILRQHFADLAARGHPGLPRRFWELFYPLSWKSELRTAAASAGLDAPLVAAVVREESSFFPRARSRAGARGLMQIMPQTARSLLLRRGVVGGTSEVLDEPGPNLEIGAQLLAGFLREFGDPRLGLAAYNAGPARVREWWRARRSDDLETFVEQIPFAETRHFVKRVLVSWEEYRRIYGDGW